MLRKTITKAVLLTSLLCLFCAVPASGSPLSHRITFNRHFFARFEGYGDYAVYDIENLEKNRIGVILLNSAGLEERFVFDLYSGAKLYEYRFVPEKSKRREMYVRSIRMSDAKALSQEAISREKELRRALLPKKNEPQTDTPVSGDEILRKIRRDVERNPEVSSMRSEDILRRFKADVKKAAEEERMPPSSVSVSERTDGLKDDA